MFSTLLLVSNRIGPTRSGATNAEGWLDFVDPNLVGRGIGDEALRCRKSQLEASVLCGRFSLQSGHT